MRESNPLTVGALGATVIDLPDGLTLDLGSLISGGVVGQAAVAGLDGHAAAASGAIGSGGGVGLGDGSEEVTGDLTVHLGAALGSSLTDAVADIELRLQAIQAHAQLTGGIADAGYSLAGAQLRFTSPAVANLGTTVMSAVDELSTRTQRLSGRDGLIAADIAAVLNPVLAPAGVRADVTVTIDADLHGVVSALLRSHYSSSGISVDLETGTVELDLAAFAGGTLNDLPPHRELLSADVLSPVLSGVTGSLADLVDSIVAGVTSELDGALLTVTADVSALTPQEATSREECRDVTSVVPQESASGGSSSGLIGGLLGGVTGAVEEVVEETLETVTRTVCETVLVPRADLVTSLALHLEARLASANAGEIDVVRAELTVLGATVALPLGTLDARIAAIVGAQVYGSEGAIAQFERRLQSEVIDPALVALLGPSGALSLADVLSVQINVPEYSADRTAVTQTAVQVRVAGGSVLDLQLANAAVAGVGSGPGDGPGGPTGPGDGNGDGDGGDDGAAGPGGPGMPGDGTGAGTGFTGFPDRLAMTGGSILLIVLAIAGLLFGGGALTQVRRASVIALS